MPAAAKIKAMKINSFTLSFLRLLAKRYAQAEKSTCKKLLFKYGR
jgi:hypothetical protein